MFRKNYGIIPSKNYDLSCYDLEGVREDAAKHCYCELPDRWKIFKTKMDRSDSQPRSWGLLKIEIEKDGKPYMNFIRNYPSLPIAYAVQGEEEFLITSEDYQCITIINLTKKEIKSYSDIDDISHGAGFCPMYIDWDEGVLYIEGCIWACPEETMIVENIDLNNPINHFNNAEWRFDDEEEEYCEDEWDEDE